MMSTARPLTWSCAPAVMKLTCGYRALTAFITATVWADSPEVFPTSTLEAELLAGVRWLLPAFFVEAAVLFEAADFFEAVAFFEAVDFFEAADFPVVADVLDTVAFFAAFSVAFFAEPGVVLLEAVDPPAAARPGVSARRPPLPAARLAEAVPLGSASGVRELCSRLTPVLLRALDAVVGVATADL